MCLGFCTTIGQVWGKCLRSSMQILTRFTPRVDRKFGKKTSLTLKQFRFPMKAELF